MERDPQVADAVTSRPTVSGSSANSRSPAWLRRERDLRQYGLPWGERPPRYFNSAAQSFHQPASVQAIQPFDDFPLVLIGVIFAD